MTSAVMATKLAVIARSAALLARNTSRSPCGRGVGGGVGRELAPTDPSPHPPPTRGGGAALSPAISTVSFRAGCPPAGGQLAMTNGRMTNGRLASPCLEECML